MRKVQPVLLVILDGFGLKRQGKHNAIAAAKTPNIDRFFAEYPWTAIDPTGRGVGLPPQQMGTSEVGHLNLGAGRVVHQDLVRISNAIKDKTFFANPVLQLAIEQGKGKHALHLIGLCSDGGVHSHLDHLLALIQFARREGVENLFIHAITDGRDTPPRVAAKYLKRVALECKRQGIGEIATVLGRYYAMDRDNRWEREKVAYDALTRERETASSPEAVVKAAYRRGEGDEFIKPAAVKTKSERSSRILDHDSVIFFNFRPDRARQLTHAFVDKEFRGFRRTRREMTFASFTEYDAKLRVPLAFPPEHVKNSLAEWLSRERVRQLHIAETEKYAHVTYFFNGGREKIFKGSDRVLIPSPKVATYDTAPGMSAEGITATLLKKLRTGIYGFTVVNFANADMVGHTGKLAAAVKGVEVLDQCLGQLARECRMRGVTMMITADHGNAEEMAGTFQTSHTLNKVPFIVLDDTYRMNKSMKECIPADVAPTILKVMGLDAPPEMTGRILIQQR